MPNQSNTINPLDTFQNMMDLMNDRITALENSFNVVSAKQDNTIQKMQQMTTEFMSDQRKINKEHENRIREAQLQYKQLAAQLTLTTDKLTAASITSTQQSKSLEKKMEKVLEELVKARPRYDQDQQFPALQPSTKPPSYLATLRALKDNKELTPEQEALLTREGERATDRKDRILRSISQSFGISTGITAISLVGRSIGHLLINEPQCTELKQHLRRKGALLENFNPLKATKTLTTDKAREFCVSRIAYLYAFTLIPEKKEALLKGFPNDVAEDIKKTADEIREKRDAEIKGLRT
ncbi:hypothetical protein HDU76_008424 [Blyttiomyces sp. JEL0837]|nr:hypothetical protein HDU76_008424 [Blyttiomyces sp. JEL0837]